ncbi:hypothetical protein G9A89_023066 [Geosiphon pyriformis]|nr:hypothetical protein G9A89_023066 [Geosiphon pyriformis]
MPIMQLKLHWEPQKAQVHNKSYGLLILMKKHTQVPGGLVAEMEFKTWLKCQKRFLCIIEVFLKTTAYDTKHFTFTGFGRSGIYAVYAELKLVVTYKTVPIVITLIVFSILAAFYLFASSVFDTLSSHS